MKITQVLTAMFVALAMCSAQAGNTGGSSNGNGYKKKNHCPNGSQNCGTLSGTIDIFGEVQECLDLTVLDTVAEVDFDNLGDATVSGQKVGQFTLDSNAAEGFSLTFSSSFSGELKKVGSGGGTNETIPYLVSLVNTGGTLGAGTASPASTSGLSLATPVTLDFAGANAAPTTDLAYNVNLSMDPQPNLEPGTYADTITIQLSAL